MSDDLRFSSAGRFAGEEDELELTSVGIDIGSTTSHLLFSLVRLERRGSRYVPTERRVLYESRISLTPLTGQERTVIDRAALGRFIDAEYAAAGFGRSEIDAGALILTGLAARRDNAREIGQIFADEAGRFVTVTAGDGLEATMAAHGSGAAAASGNAGCTLVIDVGGGTTKFAVCVDGAVATVSALDVGARLVMLAPDRRVTHVEPAGKYFGNLADIDLTVGRHLSDADIAQLTGCMADAVLDIASGDQEQSRYWAPLLRLPPLPPDVRPEAVFVSGGVSAFLSGAEQRNFGDLGPFLAAALAERIPALSVPVRHGAGIRATVMGASQYTVQVSGSTIFVDPPGTLPMTNIPVVAPALDLTGDTIDKDDVAAAVRAALHRVAGDQDDAPAALALHWGGSATFQRLTAFCDGLTAGMESVLAAGHPLVLVSDGDVGGLLGMHLRGTAGVTGGVVSVDGIDLKEFDFVDIGAMIPGSGAVPLVIKSLLFPKSEAISIDGL